MASNKALVPGAKAPDRFKMEAASDVGVTLKQGDNGDLTSRQAGSVGSKKPVRNAGYERENRIVDGHKITVRYTYVLTV